MFAICCRDSAEINLFLEPNLVSSEDSHDELYAAKLDRFAQFKHSDSAWLAKCLGSRSGGDGIKACPKGLLSFFFSAHSSGGAYVFLSVLG